MADGLSWLFFGAGAIGTYIGGSLLISNRSQTGQQRVVFVERPGVAEEIRRSGLQLNLQGEEYTVPDPQITSSLAEALQMGPFDVAVFALKSFDTATAIAGYQAHLAELPPFICLSNGVENEATLQAALGPQRVIAGTVTSAVGRRGNGDIILERLRGIGIAGGHNQSARIANALDSAGLHARLYPDAASMKWSKMLTNLIANASSAILDMTPTEIFAHPGLYNLEIRQQREALAVMSALKLHVVDLPGTPVRLLALGAG
jgi:2-dehydropantoate 2-reductase